MSHEDYMAQALRLARQGWNSTRPNPRVGCLLVREGQVVGEGAHLKAGEPHAEIHALRQAGPKAAGATVYVTLEPCSHQGRTPPCAEALIQAGVAHVFVAMQDPNPQVSGQGLALLRAAGIAVTTGLLEAAARALNLGFIQRMETGRPRVLAKQAMSLDGRTAMASGESQWITSPQARADVQRLRAESCALVTGIGSLLADNSRLNVRDPQWLANPAFTQPLRVVLDTHLKIPLDAAILVPPGQVLIATSAAAFTAQKSKVAALEAQGAQVQVLPLASDGRLDLPALLDALGARACNQILVEAGARLTGALMQQGLIDEFWLYVAPKFLGHQALGLLHLPALERLADAPQMQVLDLSPCGPDWRFQLRPF